MSKPSEHFPRFPKDADERDACRGAHRINGCGAGSPVGWVCTRGAKHRGDHIAAVSARGGTIVERWPRENEP